MASSSGNSLASQVFWGQNDPAYRLHDRLSRSKASNQKLHRIAPSEVAALTIKAWNFWVQGKSVQLLRWTMPGHNRMVRGAEEFPSCQEQVAMMREMPGGTLYDYHGSGPGTHSKVPGPRPHRR